MKILIIDNYDSFVYNLYQLVGEILQDTGQAFTLDVRRNNQITIEEIKNSQYDRIIISPGPGSPDNPEYFGVCRDVILEVAKITPVLGVCLGMQGIADYYGGKVVRAKQPMHGKTSYIKHNAKGLFSNVSQDISVMRYHSLIVERKSLPDVLEITAESTGSPGKEIMGLRHKLYPLSGVQFHPESFVTEQGRQILKNFLNKEILNLSKPLSVSQAYNLQIAILNNQYKTESILKIFKALDKRPVTAQELLGFFRASQEFMKRLPGSGQNLLDTCGTGGDGKNTFNISTVSALVCASLGVKVAKHGNRAASSKCGSADVLEALGVNINLSPERAKTCLDRSGLTFMFAPLYHPAFKYAKEARVQFGKKTYFNLLGPLLNPANAGFRLIGVANETHVPLILELLKQSGVKKALVISSRDGLDEISVSAKTQVYEMNGSGKVKKYLIDPKKFGFNNLKLVDLQVENLDQASRVFLDVLSGRGKPAQIAAVILNSAAGLLAANAVKNFGQGVKLADKALKTGKALAQLAKLIKFSNQ